MSALRNCRALFGGNLPQPSSSTAFLQHLGSPRGSHAGYANLTHCEQGVEIANASRRLHLDLGRGVFPHKPEVFQRSPARGITCRGLDPIDTNLAANLAEEKL